MKILFSCFIILLLSIFTQEIDIAALKKDPIMVEYRKVFAALKKENTEKKYNFPANYAELQKEFRANPSKDYMKKRLKENGMTNADEFVDKITLQTTLMFTFLKRATYSFFLGDFIFFFCLELFFSPDSFYCMSLVVFPERISCFFWRFFYSCPR